MRKLQEAGYIIGFAAQLNPRMLDMALLVFIEVVLDRTTPDVFEAFRHSVHSTREIVECIWLQAVSIIC